MEPELIRDLGGIHGIRQVLLICKDKKKSIAEFVFVEHTLQLFTRLAHTLTIVGIDDKDDALGVLKVMSP